MTTENQTEEPEFTAAELEEAGMTESEIQAFAEGNSVSEEEQHNDDSSTDEIVDVDKLEVQKAEEKPKEESPVGEDELPTEDLSADSEKTAGDDALAESTDSQEKTFAPQFKTDSPEETKVRMDGILNEMELLGERLDNGEVTAKEFQTENFRLMGERDQIVSSVNKAEMFGEMNQQSAEQLWQGEQDDFFSLPANQIYESSTIKFSALDTAIKEVANDADFTGKSGADVLAEADRRVREEFGMAVDAAVKDEGKGNKAADELASRRASKKDAVTTLGDLPAADKADVNGGEFASLDSMDGLELEQAVNNMNPEQQERYYRS